MLYVAEIWPMSIHHQKLMWYDRLQRIENLECWSEVRGKTQEEIDSLSTRWYKQVWPSVAIH